jgi:hypothetical protein
VTGAGADEDGVQQHSVRPDEFAPEGGDWDRASAKLTGHLVEDHRHAELVEHLEDLERVAGSEQGAH